MIKETVKELFDDVENFFEAFNDTSLCSKTYDEMKETENIKKYARIWSNLGLTHGLEEEEIEKLSLVLSQLTTYIMNANENELDGISQLEKTGYILYPLTRRVFYGENVNFNFKKYVNSLKRVCMDNVFRNVENKMGNGMNGYFDTEATACVVIANALIFYMTGKDDDYVEEYINNEIDVL